MPRGRNVTLATGTGSLFGTLTGGERATLLILNPNDGIVYLTINSQASPAVWDFIVPSQSRAYLPGPWLTYGVYYLDQSGAGHSGNITIFESDIQMLLPDYGSIGRALQAQVTTVDIVEGAQPGNPAVGIGRLWVDNNGRLNTLLSTGATEPVIYQGDAAGGALNGTYPNPGLAAIALTGALTGNLPNASIQFAGPVSGSRFSVGVGNINSTICSITITAGTWLLLARGMWQGTAQQLTISIGGATTYYTVSGDGNWNSGLVFDLTSVAVTTTKSFTINTNAATTVAGDFSSVVGIKLT